MPQTITPKRNTSSDGLIMPGHHQIKSSAGMIGDSNNATYRLASFRSYLDVPIQPKVLAEAGFYYTGNDDVTQCYSCGSCVRNWEKDDNPQDAKYHKRDCAIIGRQRQQQTRETSARTQQPIANTISPNSNRGNNTANAEISAATNAHEKTFSQEQEQWSSTFTLSNPMNPHMSREDVRLSTFRDRGNWQSGRIQATPEQIAKAGFFYLGSSDKVKCFYCNGGLERWEYNDDPWIEHAKWYPHCEFTLRHKGPAFVSDVTSQFPNLIRPSAPTSYDIPPQTVVYQNYGSWIPPRRNGFISHSRGVEITDPREEERKREVLIESAMSSSSLIKQARDMGYSNEDLKRALEKQYQVKDKNFDNIDELLETLNNLEQQNSSTNSNQPRATQRPVELPRQPATAEERTNRLQQLQEEKKCKICLDEDANVVFVPCGHLSTCVSCAQRVSNCPICRSFVRQKIKTYIS